MESYQCAACGRTIQPAPSCPNCGSEQPQWAEDLTRIERSIAEMKARDAEILREQQKLAADLQTALFKRNMLAHAGDKKIRQRGRPWRKPGRPGPQHPGAPGPTATATGAPPRVPRQSPTVTTPPGPPPGPPRRPAAPGPTAPGAAAPTETSSREVQNVLLTLGALLLGVAAVVFAVVAISSLDDLGRVAILITATALTLLAPPLIAPRGLTSTAESVAAVGLILALVDGYALWTVDQVRGTAAAGTVFAATTCLVVGAVALAYGRFTGLSVPRFAAVVTLQPVLPLLAYGQVTDVAGWALVLTLVATGNLALARLASSRRWQPGWLTLPATDPATDPGELVDVATTASVHEPQARATERPESTPEAAEADLAGTPTRRAAPAAVPVPWLPELTWALHGAAVLSALAFAVAALLRAGSVPAAAQAGAVLVLAAALGLAGALTERRRPLPEVASAVFTLAVIGALARVASLALPGRALVLTALVIAGAGLAVRAVPVPARRGPQWGLTIALTVCGAEVAGRSLRAAAATVEAALPAWDAALESYPAQLAADVGAAPWQLPLAALLLTLTAVGSLPPRVRREFAVAGVVLTALGAPAALGLSWSTAPLPPVLAAIGIGLAGLRARTDHDARVHAAGAGFIGLFGAAAALVRPELTAVVLLSYVLIGVIIGMTPRLRISSTPADVLAGWAAGGAAFALPGAVAAATTAMTAAEQSRADATVAVLCAGFLAACATLCHAAVVQVAQRRISTPLSIGTGLGTVVVAGAAFTAPQASTPDIWVGALLLAAALLVLAAPWIDRNRRIDQVLDGADFAAAAATVALIGTLARISTVLTPSGQFAVTAGLILLVAVAARAMPEDWRRGPILGVTVSGAVIAALAGWQALVGGLGVLAVPGPIWAGDLSRWPAGAAHVDWQSPVALALLAAATAILLPRPWRYDVSAVLAVLATISAPVAFGLPWPAPVLVGTAVAAGYGIAAVLAADPRAALSRTLVAALVALHAVGTGLPRAWSTALALALVLLTGLLVANLSRSAGARLTPNLAAEGLPPHLALIGGAATVGALLAAPGLVASAAAELGHPAPVLLTGALAASSLALAVVAAGRRRTPQFLPYATIGIAGGATAVALIAIAADLNAGVYAAAAVLLAVLAELVRGATAPPAATGVPVVRRWTFPGSARWAADPAQPHLWTVSPEVGALGATLLPAALAVASLAPALLTALVQPYQLLTSVWEGAPAELRHPDPTASGATHVLAALLLTLSGALAAVGFSGGRRSRAVPVVLPGVAVTLLITPIALGRGWPLSTLAALTVFTVLLLGLALTPPPAGAERARPVRLARVLVFAIGMAAGGAGLAGSLATRDLTLFTLGAAVGVGAVAALFGVSARDRIAGWLFGSIMAQLFVLTAGLVAGVAPRTSAFGVLAIGAVLLVLAARLPRLRREGYRIEASVVEWCGYASALMALALAYDSSRHVAALLAALGAVLGIAATRPGRQARERRILFWAVVACEISAWWLLMRIADVALPEAYTLPFALLALVAGLLEGRQRAELNSWTAYGPALIAAFLPTLVLVVATPSHPMRQVLLLLGAVATLIFGAYRRHQAPFVVGAVVTALTALHALFSFGPWLVLIPVGIVLIVLGANNERRRQTQERLQATLRGMR